MSTPTVTPSRPPLGRAAAALPVLPPAPDLVAAGAAWRTQLRAMASSVTLVLGPGSSRPADGASRVAEVLAETERQCTRFDPASDLMRANAAGEAWCEVGARCLAALVEAERAHRLTGGLFDPRTLETLTGLGYDRALPFAAGDVRLDGPVPAGTTAAARWAPEFDLARSAVRIGARPVDLGGIGKGLAVRWAAEALAASSDCFLVDAGGDCYLRGAAPEGTPWQVGVEDPRGGDRPVAVLGVCDAACVTSSVRLRQWQVGGRRVHHLIDPRTGLPGGKGLLAVTVVDADPAEAEVWSKAFFLHGRAGIAEAVASRQAAALWVHDDGSVGLSEAMRPLVVWQDLR